MAWSQGLGWNSRFGWETPAAAGGTSRTTLFTWTDFNAGAGWTVTAGSVVANNQTGVSGSTTADTYTADGTSAQHKIGRTMSITASAVTVFSVTAARGTVTRFHIREDQQTGNGAIFDLATGSVVSNLVGGTGTITSQANGFYLCEVQFTYIAATFSGFRIGLLPATATDLSFDTNTSSDTIFLDTAKVQTIP
jgi:hypothetical protein